MVLYDRGPGVWATRLWWQLRVFGFDDVVVMEGGLPAWRAGNHPVGTGDVAPRPAAFVPRLRRHLLAASENLAARGSGIAAP